MQIIFLAAVFGASLQEAMYWHEKRYNIFKSGVDKSKGYKIYIIIVAVMILMSSIGTVIWFYGRLSETPPMDAAILGAAFPSIFKAAVKSQKAANIADGPKLGSGGDISKILKNYF